MTEVKMKLHEHQGKTLLGKYGVTVPHNQVALSVDEALQAIENFDLPLVVKAQIHAGGRGKGRFVEASTDEEIAAAASGHPLGWNLHTWCLHVRDWYHRNADGRCLDVHLRCQS